MLILAILTAFAAINAENFSVNDEDGLRAAFVSIGGASSGPSHTITVDRTINLLAQINNMGLNDKNIVIRGINEANIITSVVNMAPFYLGGNNLDITLQDITLQDGGNSGLFQYSGSVLRILNGSYLRPNIATERNVSSPLFNLGSPDKQLIIGGDYGIPYFSATRVFAITAGSVLITKGQFIQQQQFNVPYMQPFNCQVTIGGSLANQTPTFTGQQILQVQGDNFLRIIRGTFTGNANSNSTILVNQGNITIGEEGFSPSFKNLGLFSFPSRTLRIISGSFSRDADALPFTIRILSNASVTIGQDGATAPQFSDLTQIIVNNSRLDIASGSFSSSDTAQSLISTLTNAVVTIGAGASIPSITATRVIEALNSRVTISKGSFIGSDSIRPYFKFNNTAVIIGDDGTPEFTFVDQFEIIGNTTNINAGSFTSADANALLKLTNVDVTIGSVGTPSFRGVRIIEDTNTAPVGTNPFRTVAITRGTFQLPAGSGSAGIQIVINNAAATFGINTTVSPTFTGLELLQVTGSTLNVAFSTIVGTLLAPAQIRISNSTLTYGSSTFNPTATNLEVIDIRNANLVVNRGSLSGTATNGLQILISYTSVVTIGGQTTTNPTFANFNLINIDSSQLNVFGGAITAKNALTTLINATNSDVNIGRVATPQPALTLTSAKVLNVTGGTLNIYRGTLTGNDRETVIITTNETVVTIGDGAAPIFNGAKALDVTNGTLSVFRGTFTGIQSVDHILIKTRDVDLTIGETYTPTMTAVYLLDVDGGHFNLIGGQFNQPTTYPMIGSIIKIANTEVLLGFDSTDYNVPNFNGIETLALTNVKLNMLSGRFVGVEAGFSIIATDTELTIGSAQQRPLFQYAKLIYVDRGKLDIIKFSFSGPSTIGNCIRANEADFSFGDVNNAANQEMSGSQQGPKYSNILLTGCRTVDIKRYTFQNNANRQASSTVDVFYTPAVTVHATPDTKLTISDCIFTGNAYTGHGALSGAVFIDFIDNPTVNKDGFILIENTRFLDNVGTVAGAIAFKGKSSSPITFSNLFFRGNRFNGAQIYSGLKSSGIFTFEDLSSQLGANPFTTCYTIYKQGPSEIYPDGTYGNQIPFYVSNKGNNYVAGIQSAAYDSVYVQTGGITRATGTIEDPFGTFLSAVGSFPIQGGDIILLGDTYTCSTNFTTFPRYSIISINPSTENSILYNTLTGYAGYPFGVNSYAVLTVKDFKIVQGDASELGFGTQVRQFFYISGYAEVRLTNIEFSTNLRAGILGHSYISTSTGSLYVEKCNFNKADLPSGEAAINVVLPQTVEIKESNFVGIKSTGTSAAALNILQVNAVGKVTVTGNTFQDNERIGTTNLLSGAVYIQVTVAHHLPIDLHDNTFIHNSGQYAGAIYVNYQTAPQITTGSFILDGSKFSLNTHTDPLYYSDIYCNQGLSVLFGTIGIFLHPLEVTSGPDAVDDETLELTLQRNITDAEFYKFKTVSSALSFAGRFRDYPKSPITIIDSITSLTSEAITGNDIIIQGKRKLTESTTQSTISSDVDTDSIFVFSGTNDVLRWLTFVRVAQSSATVLIDVIGGSLTVDSCTFNDRSTVTSTQPEFTFIKASGTSTTVINSIFNGNQYDNGAAINKTSGILNVEKSIFTGAIAQTGPFIRLRGSGANTISSNIFRNVTYYGSLVPGTINFAAVIIDTDNSVSSISLNTFTGLVNGPGITIDSTLFTVTLNSNVFRDNGQSILQAGGVRITKADARGSFTALYNTFYNNTATRAGVIFADVSSGTPTYIIQYNLFINNTANAADGSKANDILILSNCTYRISDNVQIDGDSSDALIQSGDGVIEIANAYSVVLPYQYQRDIHVRAGGENLQFNPDRTDVSIGSFGNPLKTIDYAVNQRDKAGNIDLILYRQNYPLQYPLWIYDDDITIKDEVFCSSPYYTTDKSVISASYGSSHAFSIRGGSFVLNAVNIDITSNVSPFVLIFITGQGSFEAKDASITVGATNSKLIDSNQFIKSFKLQNINPVTFTGTSLSSSLISTILNNVSTFDITDSTIDARNNQRYASLRIDDTPINLIFKNVKFSSLSTNTDSKIAQIYGIEINPIKIFDHNTIPDTTSYHPLLQTTNERFSGEYDDLLFKTKWSNLGQFNQLPSELSASLTINSKIAYIGARHVFQTIETSQLNVVVGGHLTLRGITFIQQATGVSVIQVNSINSVVSLEDVGFQVASQRLLESGVGKLTSSQFRKDASKIKKSDDKINIDYYLRSLEKTTASKILVNPFVTVVYGYSLSLQGIKFGDWISSGEKPLIDVSGPLQYATIENVQVKKIGRKYGGPHILNLNLHSSGEAKINNVTIDGRGWVPSIERKVDIRDKNEYLNDEEEEKGKCGKENDKPVQDEEELTDTLDVAVPDKFNWKYPAIKVKGGKLRISDSTFVGLGVDGALVLDGVEADLANSTLFEENSVYEAAEAEGRKKKIPSELKSLGDENDSDEEYDEDDRRIRELHRYRGYVKNVIAEGETTLKAYNVSFIGEKLAKKKDSYKKGYDLNIQHGHEAKLAGEIGQSNNAFAVPEISYVKSSYLKGSDKDTSDGKIEKTVQIEIRTKGKLIPGVEWFFELQNKKDPEDNKRTLHYNLLHRKVWEEATKEEKLQGWYISEDENKLI
ncbi:MAG: hypothetical protein EZS28_004870, partial [Streblomastix strix]